MSVIMKLFRWKSFMSFEARPVKTVASGALRGLIWRALVPKGFTAIYLNGQHFCLGVRIQRLHEQHHILSLLHHDNVLTNTEDEPYSSSAEHCLLESCAREENGDYGCCERAC